MQKRAAAQLSGQQLATTPEEKYRTKLTLHNQVEGVEISEVMNETDSSCSDDDNSAEKTTEPFLKTNSSLR